MAMILQDSFIIDTDTPYLQSINLTYTKPMGGIYPNLNTDPKIRAQVTKYFYYKLLDDWLYDDLIDLLNYFVVSGDKVEMIKKIYDYKDDRVKKDTTEMLEKKTDYIEDNLFSKTDMYNALFNFTRETNTNWYDLPKHEYLVMGLVKKRLRKKIKEEIEGHH